MILQGRVTNIDKINTNDGATLYQLRFVDVSKPMALRTQGEFITYLSEEKRKVLPSGDDIDGAEITVAVKSMKGADGGVSVRGQVVPGLVSPEQLTGDKLPQKPETVKPGAKAA